MDWKIVMLSNGMPLVMKEKKDMYSVAAGIWVRSGSRYEKPSVSGSLISLSICFLREQ